MKNKLVKNAVNAARIAKRLINNSRWFQVEPWPEDHYYFTFKDEPGIVELFEGIDGLEKNS